MYGVSPAYFISKFGDRFTPREVASTLAEIAGIGYDTYQLEVFHPDTLDAWANGENDRVVDAGKAAGLAISQFVAHFLLNGFGDPESVFGSFGPGEMETVIRMLEPVPECRLITVPLPAFCAPSGYDYQKTYEAFVAKARRLCNLAESAGFQMGLEIMPGALVSGTDGFLRLSGELDGCRLAYNFDTGHAWAQKEPVSLIPGKLSGRINGTHLCDNDGGENLSLAPGDGTISWTETFQALLPNYTGSLDVEIKASPDSLVADYRRGLLFVQSIIQQLSNSDGGES